MPEVKFGGDQLKNPTPARLSDAIQVFTVVASIVLAWVGTADFIGPKSGQMIQSILGLLVGIANGIKPFFGVQTNQTSVPIDQVAAMDEKDK